MDLKDSRTLFSAARRSRRGEKKKEQHESKNKNIKMW